MKNTNYSIIFQGPLTSIGRTFESYSDGSENRVLVYNCLEELAITAAGFAKLGVNCYIALWSEETSQEQLKQLHSIENLSVILINKINYARGLLGSNISQVNKLHHYYSMSQSLEHLLINEKLDSTHIVLRVRTDITFDIYLLDDFMNKVHDDLSSGKMTFQYRMEKNSRWLIDFMFGGTLANMFTLYKNLYNNTNVSRDGALSVHQDIAKSVSCLYVPSIMFYKEGAPLNLKREERLNLTRMKRYNKNSSKIMDLLENCSLYLLLSIYTISKVVFKIYCVYESILNYAVHSYFIIPMPFRLQSSIVWRGGKCTDDYLLFKNEHYNSELIFMDEKW